MTQWRPQPTPGASVQTTIVCYFGGLSLVTGMAMRRHTLFAVFWIAFGLVWLPLAAEAQQAKLHRLGFLGNHFPSSPSDQTFLQTLRELGYVEGKNIAIETRYAYDNLDRLPELAREL